MPPSSPSPTPIHSLTTPSTTTTPSYTLGMISSGLDSHTSRERDGRERDRTQAHVGTPPGTPLALSDLTHPLSSP